MLKILQARLQQYMNHELSDVQAGFRKGRGTRDLIANICWIIGKNNRDSDRLYFSWAPESLQMVIVARKLKDACSLEEKL